MTWKETLGVIGVKLLEMFEGPDGKLSWNRVTGSILIAYLMFEAMWGGKPNKEMVDVLKTVLLMQIGAVATTSAATAIGAGMTARTTIGSPEFAKPTEAATTIPPTTPTAPASPTTPTTTLPPVSNSPPLH